MFDLERGDPLMLSNIVGEAVVSCWSMENILQIDTNGKKEMHFIYFLYRTRFFIDYTSELYSYLKYRNLRNNNIS